MPNYRADFHKTLCKGGALYAQILDTYNPGMDLHRAVDPEFIEITISKLGLAQNFNTTII